MSKFFFSSKFTGPLMIEKKMAHKKLAAVYLEHY